jgi:hypothetical protein
MVLTEANRAILFCLGGGVPLQLGKRNRKRKEKPHKIANLNMECHWLCAASSAEENFQYWSLRGYFASHHWCWRFVGPPHGPWAATAATELPTAPVAAPVAGVQYNFPWRPPLSGVVQPLTIEYLFCFVFISEEAHGISIARSRRPYISTSIIKTPAFYHFLHLKLFHVSLVEKFYIGHRIFSFT